MCEIKPTGSLGAVVVHQGFIRIPSMSARKPGVDGITMPNEIPVRISSPSSKPLNPKNRIHELFSPPHFRKRHGLGQAHDSVVITCSSLRKSMSDMDMSRDYQSTDKCETSSEFSNEEGDFNQLTCGFRVNSKWVMAHLTKESVMWEVPSKKPKDTGKFASGCIPIVEIIAVEHVRPQESHFRWLCREKVQYHKLVIHTFQREKGKNGVWTPCKIEFMSPDGSAISKWVSTLDSRIASLMHRPRTLWVLINPFGGKRQANKIWRRKVLPIFQQAGIKCIVTVTSRKNHAYDAITGSTTEALMKFDGIIAIGGDGFFQEIANGLLDLGRKPGNNQTSLLQKIRVGHLPAGSTDAVSWSLHGNSCVISAALRVVFGDRLNLDVMKIHTNPGGQKYSTCLVGYGFMGDIIRTSESLRCLGPVRYDLAGFLAFLRGRSHRARILYKPARGSPPSTHNVCRSCCPWCKVSSDAPLGNGLAMDSKQSLEVGTDWSSVEEPLVEIEGEFMSIMVTVSPCRSGQSPQGVTPYAHLGDGRIHLVLVRKTSRIKMLQWLISLSNHGVQPGEFSFVETVDAGAVRIEPIDESSSWNVDGEHVIDQELTAIPIRGLLQVFSRGVEHDSIDRKD